SFDLQIDKPVLDVALCSGLLWTISMLADFPRPPRWLACGAICGLLALSRENTLVLIPLLAVWAWVRDRNQARRSRVRSIAMLFAGTLCVLGPVSLRNSLIGRAFHLTTAQFGPNFYIGNSAGSDGFYRPLRAGRGD